MLDVGSLQRYISQIPMLLYATVSLAILSLLSQVNGKKRVYALLQFELLVCGGSDLFE